MLCRGLSRIEFSNKVQNCYEIGHVPIGRRHDIAHIGMSRPIGALFSFIVVLNFAAGTQLITERQLVVAGVADDASDVSAPIPVSLLSDDQRICRGLYRRCIFCATHIDAV